jgi:hypothetical protein
MSDSQTTEKEIRILRCLIQVWAQYNSWGSDWDKGRLTHACMSAGENAADLLEEYGLAVGNGWEAVLTEEGRKLLNSEAIA